MRSISTEMKIPSKSFIYILLPIALLCFAAVANANLVTNPGFETGDFTGWTQGGDTSFVGVNNAVAHSGTFGAFMGPVGSDGTLSQTLATTAGGIYSVSYWLASQAGATTNDFSASFNGVTIAGSVLNNAGAFGYTQFTFSGLVATTNSTVLGFTFRNDDSFWLLDDVSVDGAINGVPDMGSSALLLGLALLGLCLAQRTLRAQGTALIRQ
jgi:hypothetical protein